MEILLIRPKTWNDFKNKNNFHDLNNFLSPSTFPPLGLLYVGAALENDGHNVTILDCNKEENDIKTIKEYVRTSDIIGFTVTNADFKTTNSLIKIIKKINPDIPIIIGGPHCIFFQKKSLETVPDADISVTSEADKSITQIIRYFQGDKKLSNIPGIFYKKNNKIIKGKDLEIIKDLNDLPFPARHLIDKYDYGKGYGNYLFKPKLTSMISSKGCPYKCRFCSRYGNFIDGWKVRERTAENVVDEILKIDKIYGSVFIVDDNFLANKKRALKIMDSLIKNKTSIELLIEGARVDSADEKLYRKMKKANVKLIGFGIESGNQDVLDFYNKKFTIEQARKAVKLANRMGFITMSTFILG
ncbi:MAG: radical SAM protein, partial [Candidatus Lokiarchaeota archaeon]|nr:radical SAM protein [Candidatus Lokiarchaeota archaeon]